jgi:hypothetical protein
MPTTNIATQGKISTWEVHFPTSACFYPTLLGVFTVTTLTRALSLRSTHATLQQNTSNCHSTNHQDVAMLCHSTNLVEMLR